MLRLTICRRLSALICFFFNFVAGLMLYAVPSLFEAGGVLFFLCAFVGLLWNVHQMKNNFLIQLRLIFLAAIGFYAGFSKLLDPDMIFLDFGAQVHTFDIAVRMFALTLLAMSGVQFAYGLAVNKKIFMNKTLIQVTSERNLAVLHVTSAALIFLIGYFSALSYGLPIWEAPYGLGESEGQLLGSLQLMGVILLGLNYLYATKLNKSKYWLLSWSSYFYLLVWGILVRGGRLEFLSGALTIFVVHQIVRGEDRPFSIKSYIYLVVAAILMEYIGHLRTALVGGEQETMFEGIARMLDDGVLFMGTISGIASAFANVVHMVQNNVIDWQWGGPYLEYMLRTPPEFLYPDRPKDLSAIFEQYGYISIGGFFELAEAYLSFGLLGVWIIPGLITYLFVRIQDKAKAGSMLHYILLLGILSVFMRGAWYQTFAYYKAMVAGLVIYGTLRLITAPRLSAAKGA